MATKTLTGTYSAGYSLSSSFAALNLTASAYVGGTGVMASAAARVTNQGRVLAAPGAASNYYGGGGNVGVSLAAGGSVNSFSTIAGGVGGAGEIFHRTEMAMGAAPAAWRLCFRRQERLSITP